MCLRSTNGDESIVEGYLETVYQAVERLGMPLALAAWSAVFFGSIAMARVLRTRRPTRWGPAIGVGAIGLAAHILDYAVTLRMSPLLEAEANPIWRIIIDAWGLPLAKAYGLSGKILLAILSFELFAFYAAQRADLFPESGEGFRSFWRRFGASEVPRSIDWRNLANFSVFSFSVLGPFFFYIALLNSFSNDPRYLRFPSMPAVLLSYLAGVAVAYFVLTYRAYARGERPGRVLPDDAAA